MIGKDVFIFGVGCSGTTMTYGLLQNIFTRLYGKKYYSTYEPFIWDKEKFNCPYEDASDLFSRNNSISIEGIYNHAKIPMFIDSATPEEYMDIRFFRHFSATHGPDQPHLVKFIRANGRMALFRALNPQARFLLVSRNPIDNINCAKHKFSFYGEDFYPSDCPRFYQQVKKKNKLVLDEKNTSWAQRQAEYCYQMNRAALEFAKTDINTKIFEYDEFVQDLPLAVKDFCEFLGTPFKDDYVDSLQHPTGPITVSNALSQAEFESILCFDYLYSELCERTGVTRGKSTAAIQARYDGKCNVRDFDAEYEGSTTNRLRRVIHAQDQQIRYLKKELQSK